MEQKELIQEMKAFFRVNSLGDIAEKLGYSRNTANNWSTRGITKSAIVRYQLLKTRAPTPTSISSFVMGENINNSGNNHVFAGMGHNSSTQSDEELLARFCELYKSYHTPKVERRLLDLIQTLEEIERAGF